MEKFRRVKFWENKCGHHENEYIGSVSFISPDGKGNFPEVKIDVYIYFDTCTKENDVCIRVGNDLPEYYSAGDLIGFLTRANNMEIYRKAVEVIRKYAILTFTMKD